jgi:hypothetical protein
MAADMGGVLRHEASLFIDALVWKQNGWTDARAWGRHCGKLQWHVDTSGKGGPTIGNMDGVGLETMQPRQCLSGSSCPRERWCRSTVVANG